MSVKPVNSLQEFKDIINSQRPSVFDFWATWCGPCRIISPIFEKYAGIYCEDIDFYKVDVDEQSEISQEVGIRAMPTFMAFSLGEKVHELVGANPAGLETLVKDTVATANAKAANQKTGETADPAKA